MGPELSIDWGVFQSVIISLALGGIIGLERQAQAEPEYQREVAGVRTFSLAALLGTIAALAASISPAIPIAIAAGFLILVVVHYWIDAHYRGKATGITTEIAGFIVFLLGAFVPSQPIFAASVGVVVAMILAVKNVTHSVVGRMNQKEVNATLKFLLVTVVLLPLLPNTPVDPWGIYNPRNIWFLVVLIAGISFVGYYAMKFLGPSRGIVVTGLLGGLASSTAVTLSMGGRVSQSDHRVVTRAATFAVVIANGIMFGRVLVEVAAVNYALLETLWLPMTVTGGTGIATGGLLYWRLSHSRDAEEEVEGDDVEAAEEAAQRDLELDNPFRLSPAIKFALLFVGIIGLVHIARNLAGDSGMYLAAFIAGLANTDATSLAAARMAGTGALGDVPAARTILVAAVSNSLVKAAIGAVVGNWRFGGLLLLALLPTVVVGAASIFLLV